MQTIITLCLNNNVSDDDINKLLSHCQSLDLSTQNLNLHHFKITGEKDLIIKIVNDYNHLIQHVIGLDNNNSLHTYIKSSKKECEQNALHANVNLQYTPLGLATIYHFPVGLNGSGQKIGIIELGGGYQLSDIHTYLTNLGINPSNIDVTSVSVDGGQNDFGSMSDANVEVILDIEVIVALAPNATIRVYFAPNTTTSFYNAILAAINDGCHIISISWGMYESGWGNSNLTAFNSLFQTAANNNITICVAAGDNGSSDGNAGNNVDFPSSSVFALSCGGSSLSTSNNVRTNEVVWNDNPTSSASGGGISQFFSKPSYQNNVAFNLNNFRGVPDVCGNADPNTGYKIYYNGSNTIVGGTSAVAPLYAGLIARVNQGIGTSVGFINPIIYNHPNVFYDITTGSNGAFTASTNWDACSGLGVCDGQLILSLFAPTTTASFTYSPQSDTIPLNVTFTNTSTNATSYLWDFGDNTTSLLINPTHTYNTVGSFTVTLTATNNNGSNSVSHIITTTAVVLPTSSFSYNPINGNIPLNVTFTNTSTNATSYLWDFGDNITSMISNPTHIYNTIGTFTVTLTATNNNGSNSISHIITTTAVVNPINAQFNYIISGRKVKFENLTVNNTHNYWHFDDGSTGFLRNPIHRYRNKGTYNVSLTVYNTYGTSTISKNIKIK